MDLKIVAIIKGDIIQGENHANEVTECASKNGMYTFIMWDVGI